MAAATTPSQTSEHPHVDEALQYARDVADGRILACRYVQLACERQLRDLERAERGDWDYYWDPAAAERPVKFIEALPHVKGAWGRRRELIELGPWQKFVITTLFGWRKAKSGARRFSEAYNEIPRKNGKSVLAAGVGLYCFAADDEFGAEVYSGATTEKQAWEVFRPARLMAMRTPALLKHFGIKVNARGLIKPEDMSRFEPLIGDPGDGSSPSCAIVDEYHEHDSPRLYDTMVTGMGARDQALVFVITTAGSNLAGPCYNKRNHAIKVLEGVVENEELFAVIYTVDDDDDWTTEDALKKANPNYGVSVDPEYLRGRLRNAMQVPSDQAIFQTKHLNRWVGARNAWMNMIEWRKSPPRLPLEGLKGRECILALDLASRTDVATLTKLFLPTADDQRLHVHTNYYLPEDTVESAATANASHYAGWHRQGLLTLTPGNIIDFDYIMDDIRDTLSGHNVREVAYDPWQATQLATTLFGEGAPMVEVRATVGNFSEPMKELQALVLRQQLAHGDDPVLSWMASNVAAKLDNKENIYPTKEQPENKIDGIVSLIMAVNRMIADDGPKRSVYEDRGLRTL